MAILELVFVMQPVQYACTQVCGYAGMQLCKNACTQVYGYAGNSVIKYASMLIRRYANICKLQAWKHESMQLIAAIQLCKYASMKVCIKN